MLSCLGPSVADSKGRSGAQACLSEALNESCSGLRAAGCLEQGSGEATEKELREANECHDTSGLNWSGSRSAPSASHYSRVPKVWATLAAFLEC